MPGENDDHATEGTTIVELQVGEALDDVFQLFETKERQATYMVQHKDIEANLEQLPPFAHVEKIEVTLDLIRFLVYKYHLTMEARIVVVDRKVEGISVVVLGV
jgi:hypothetical protein